MCVPCICIIMKLRHTYTVDDLYLHIHTRPVVCMSRKHNVMHNGDNRWTWHKNTLFVTLVSRANQFEVLWSHFCAYKLLRPLEFEICRFFVSMTMTTTTEPINCLPLAHTCRVIMLFKIYGKQISEWERTDISSNTYRAGCGWMHIKLKAKIVTIILTYQFHYLTH